MHQTHIFAGRKEQSAKDRLTNTPKKLRSKISSHHLILAASAVIFISSVIIGFSYISKRISTDNWLSYTNNKVGYSLIYPPSEEIPSCQYPDNSENWIDSASVIPWSCKPHRFVVYHHNNKDRLSPFEFFSTTNHLDEDDPCTETEENTLLCSGQYSEWFESGEEITYEISYRIKNITLGEKDAILVEQLTSQDSSSVEIYVPTENNIMLLFEFNKSEITELILSTFEFSDNPLKDITDSVNLHTNAKYLYRISFPLLGEELSIASQENDQFYYQYPKSLFPSPNISIEIDVTDSTEKTLDEVVENALSEKKCCLTYKKVIISPGISGIKATEELSKSTTEFIYFIYDEREYAVTSTVQKNYYYKDAQKLANRIISTLELLPETFDWKMYKNPLLNYTISYPPQFSLQPNYEMASVVSICKQIRCLRIGFVETDYGSYFLEKSVGKSVLYQQDLIFENINSKEFTIEENGTKEKYHYIYVPKKVSSKGRAVIIEYPEGSEDLTKVLSTFKFLDTKSSLILSCTTYTIDGNDIKVCATCGDGDCDLYEQCQASKCSETICSTDCGLLYCPQDCE